MAPPENPFSVPATYIRGGTSKAVFFHESDIPSVGRGRDTFLLRIMGSPDPMQIDGIGGTHIVSSKVAIIRPSRRPDADVDYTFAQVSIKHAMVGYSGNCGNISAGVGPFAINEKLLDDTVGFSETTGTVKVRIYNTGNKKMLIAHFPVDESTGRAKEVGDYAIAGYSGTGAPILMDYSLVTGATLGEGMLPTGNAVDEISLGEGSINVTICDVANIIAFVIASDLGLSGSGMPADLNSRPDIIVHVKEVRGRAAERVGMCQDWPIVDEKSPMLPMVALVSETGMDGAHVQSRLFLDNKCHSSMAGTGGVYTAACSRIPGSVIHSVLSADGLEKDSLQIRHPSGILPISVTTEDKIHPRDLPTFKSLRFVRTARYIFKGELMVPRDLPDIFSDATHTNGHSAAVDGQAADQNPEINASSSLEGEISMAG